MSSARPTGPRSTDRGRRGPFAALLRSATKSPAAANGLAQAYASLEPTERRRLLEAVVADALSEGTQAGAVLAPLLAVEPDAELARAIATAMHETGGAGLRPTSLPEAHRAGDEQHGSVVLSRPLHGDFVELIVASWSLPEGRATAQVRPMIGRDAVARELAPLADGTPFEPIAFGAAVDHLVRVLWAHRRQHGGLPAELAPLATALG